MAGAASGGNSKRISADVAVSPGTADGTKAATEALTRMASALPTSQ
jgi:hypothetical protein